MFTTTVLPPVGIATLPAIAEPHTAGEAVELQFEIVFKFVTLSGPITVVVAVGLPIVIAFAVVEPIRSVPRVKVSSPNPPDKRFR